MKSNATIIGLCAVGTMLGALGLDVLNAALRAIPPPARVVSSDVTVNMAQVLVARVDIAAGAVVGPGAFRWQDWPASALSKAYIQRAARPDAVEALTGAVARTALLPGEPITAFKLAAR